MSDVFGRMPVRASRRKFIGISVAASSAVALAACGDSGGDGEVDIDSQSKGAMDGFAADTQFTATEAFTLSLLWTEWPEVPVKDSWAFFDEAQVYASAGYAVVIGNPRGSGGYGLEHGRAVERKRIAHWWSRRF